MTSHALRVLLLHRRITVADIARDLKVHRTFVSQIISGHRSTRYVQEAIAARLDMPVATLFPLTADEETAEPAPVAANAR